jgi:hypothetical protein
MANVALDLDGTLIEKRWPEMGEWMPGAIEAVRELIDRGHRPYIYSARLSHLHPSGTERHPADVMIARMAVRDLLDEAGLQEVTICEASKPFWHVLVDDRALWYPGRAGSWKHMPDKIEGRVKGARNR